ncbi:MAG TPA: TIGR03619 family F420-dependent LLM class oxidoreductase [Acidimicrobiales bacterium]|nr:TIGR03619 family F420-dependent LLM class oxidoreductase [Acidimicrobiales bacterium]
MTTDHAGSRLPQLSLYLTTYSAEDPGGWQHVLDRARAAEAAGFDRLVVPDHVVFGERLEEYARPEVGGAAGGQQPTGPDGYWLEPLTVLSVVAGITSNIRLGTNILIAALRRPVVLAKTLSTLDVLSNGRVDLGVGVGWQREEYEAAGLEFEGRGRLLDHSLEVCQTLWREQRAAFDSPLLHFEKIHMMPKPRQPGGVPIWVSGTVNKNVIRRVARFGSGWIPWGPARVDIRTGIVQMREGLSALGRDPSTLDIVGVLPIVEDRHGAVDFARTMEEVPELTTAGVTDFRLNTAIPDGASAATDFLAALVDAFRAAR